MINEIEALFGLLIGIILNYFYIYRRSKVIGGFSLIFISLMSLVIFGGTDYEGIAWVIIGLSLIATVLEFAHAKMGATTS